MSRCFLKRTRAAVLSIHDKDIHKTLTYVYNVLCPVNHPYWGMVIFGGMHPHPMTDAYASKYRMRNQKQCNKIDRYASVMATIWFIPWSLRVLLLQSNLKQKKSHLIDGL